MPSFFVGIYGGAPGPLPGLFPGLCESAVVDVALKRLVELRDAGFEEDVLTAGLQKNRPRRALTADEMILWKKAGVPPGVIREAMK